MEKLLDLLQEFYWENRKFSNENWLLIMTNWVENLKGAYAQTYIISLQGWFIKWLVENEKIDINEFMHKSRDWEIFNEKLSAKEDDYLSLLMLLSIQDEPIRFLCDILK